MRLRTEIPGDTVTETPAAELELRAAVSSSSMIAASDLYNAGGAPVDCAARKVGISKHRTGISDRSLIEFVIVILRGKCSVYCCLALFSR